MLIRHLDFFVTLADEAHFGRAAALCGVSQPALSLAIRKLEEDLGMPLILRGQRYEGLTAEGAKVLIWGRQILADYSNLRADLSGRRAGGLTGVLRLGVSALAVPMLAQFCEIFERRNPLARIQTELLPGADIETRLADFTLDGALAALGGPGAARAKGGALLQRPLWQMPLVFACAPDHPFAAGGAITLADAATQPLCLLADLPGLPRSFRDTAIRCSSLDMVLAHLRQGAWCSLVPESFAQLLAPADDIRLIALEDAEKPLTIGGLALQRAPQAPMVRAFDEALASLAAALAPQPEEPQTPGSDP